MKDFQLERFQGSCRVEMSVLNNHSMQFVITIHFASIFLFCLYFEFFFLQDRCR